MASSKHFFVSIFFSYKKHCTHTLKLPCTEIRFGFSKLKYFLFFYLLIFILQIGFLSLSKQHVVFFRC